MMGIAACWVAVALVLEAGSAAAAFRSRSLVMACFSNADNRLMAPSKVPKNPPLDLEEEVGAKFDVEGGVAAWPAVESPISLALEGVAGVAGALTAAEAADAAAAAMFALTPATQMRARGKY
jgi:hypothetical protein